MIKVLSFSFEQSFGPFTMLLVEGSSETGLFRHLSNLVFQSLYVSSEIPQLWWSSFFLEMFKIECKFIKFKKNLRNFLRFWDNCVWKCYYKKSLLRREYLLSAVDGLSNSRETFNITLWDYLNLNILQRNQ